MTWRRVAYEKGIPLRTRGQPLAANQGFACERKFAYTHQNDAMSGRASLLSDPNCRRRPGKVLNVYLCEDTPAAKGCYHWHVGNTNAPLYPETEENPQHGTGSTAETV